LLNAQGRAVRVNSRQRVGQIGIVVRTVIGLAFGLLAGLPIRNSGMTMIFLAALFAGGVLLSWGLGPFGLLVVAAIRLGQYLVFYSRFVGPAAQTLDAPAAIFITQGIFVFMPGMALLVAAHIGLIAERMFRSGDQASRTDSDFVEPVSGSGA
jgi:hypothetical protein